MNKNFLLLIFTNTFLFSVCAQQQRDLPKDSTQALEINVQSLDTLFNFYEHNTLYFADVQVEKNNRLAYHRSVGFQNLETKQRITDKTVFLIGSITKTYTAVMIMQLVEEGKINLSDKLSQFYPEIPNSDKITIEMLLRHRSGLFNYTDAKNFLKEVVSPVSKDTLLNRFKAIEILFSPNEKYSYSNTNYVLLGFIIEDVTHNQYDKELKKRILNRLSLKNTFYGRPKDRAHLARSYQYENKEWKRTDPEWDVSWAAGAGAIAATVNDISTFFTGLFDGKLVTDTSLKKMMDLKDGYSLGLMAVPFGNKRLYGHGGGIESFRTLCAYNPEDHLLLTQASNGAYDDDPNGISIQVLNASYGQKVGFPDLTTKKTVELPVETLKNNVGEYASKNFPLTLRVFIENGKLFCQATGQSAFPLTAYSETTFGFEPAKITMEFFSKEGKRGIHFKQGSIRTDFYSK